MPIARSTVAYDPMATEGEPCSMARSVGTLIPARSATSVMLSLRRRRARRMFSPIAESAFWALGGAAVRFCYVSNSGPSITSRNSCLLWTLRRSDLFH